MSDVDKVKSEIEKSEDDRSKAFQKMMDKFQARTQKNFECSVYRARAHMNKFMMRDLRSEFGSCEYEFEKYIVAFTGRADGNICDVEVDWVGLIEEYFNRHLVIKIIPNTDVKSKLQMIRVFGRFGRRDNFEIETKGESYMDIDVLLSGLVRGDLLYDLWKDKDDGESIVCMAFSRVVERKVGIRTQFEVS